MAVTDGGGLDPAQGRSDVPLPPAAVALYALRQSEYPRRPREGAIGIHLYTYRSRARNGRTDGRSACHFHCIHHIHCSLEAHIEWTLLVVLYSYLMGACGTSHSLQAFRLRGVAPLVGTEHRSDSRGRGQACSYPLRDSQVNLNNNTVE